MSFLDFLHFDGILTGFSSALRSMIYVDMTMFGLELVSWLPLVGNLIIREFNGLNGI